MLHTKDGLLSIFNAKTPGDIVFEPSDWSIINVPVDSEKAKDLADNLFNSPASNHISLLLCRHRRKTKIKAFSNVAFFEKNWKIIDFVTLTYETPSSCSNGGLLPTSETGVLIYKGVNPDASKTKWFNEEKSNATTHWDLSPQQDEKKLFKTSYYQKLSWELLLLLYSLVGTKGNNRFIYAMPVSETEVQSLYLFCKKFGVKCQIVVDDYETSKKLIETCNQFF